MKKRRCKRRYTVRISITFISMLKKAAVFSTGIILLATPLFAAAQVINTSSLSSAASSCLSPAPGTDPSVTAAACSSFIQVLIQVVRQLLVMRSVGTTSTPACSITASPNPASLNQTVTLNWTSQNAVRAQWLPDTSGKDNVAVPSGTPDTSGSASVVASVIGNPSVTLEVFSANGASNTCTATFSVPSPYPTVIGTPGSSATIDQSSLTTSSNNPTLTGTATTDGVYIQITNSSGVGVSGSPYITVVNGRWSYSVPQTLSAGSYTVQVLGPANTATGTLTIGVSSNTSSGLTVSLDPSTPAYSLAAAGQSGVILGAFKFHNGATESIALQKVSIAIPDSISPADVVCYSIYSGGTPVGNAFILTSGIAPQRYHGVSVLTNPLTIAAGSDLVLTVKATLANIGIGQAGHSGDVIQLAVDGASAVGLNSGASMQAMFSSPTAATTQFSPGVQIFKSYPAVVTKLPDPSTLATGKQPVLLRFSITASAQGQVEIGRMHFAINAIDASFNGAELDAFTDSAYSQPYSGQTGGMLVSQNFPSGSKVAEFVSNGGPVIAAGQTLYFQLLGDIDAMSASGHPAITTALKSDASPSTASTLNGVLGKYNFIWSDDSIAQGNADVADWFNGFAIVGLPSVGISQTVIGTATASQVPTFTATPTSGPAPLSVQFKSTALSGIDLGSYVKFGDGSQGNLTLAPVCSSCNPLSTVSHSYSAAGSYTTSLVSSSGSILATAAVTVSAASSPPPPPPPPPASCAGTWAITANTQPGILSIPSVASDGTFSAVLKYNVLSYSERIAGSCSNGSIRFSRPIPNQQYSGSYSATQMSGSFTQGSASYSWSAVPTTSAAPAAPAASSVSITANNLTGTVSVTGGSYSLAWGSSNVGTCANSSYTTNGVTSPWTTFNPNQSYTYQGSAASPLTYTVSCIGYDGVTQTKSVTINPVASTPPPPPPPPPPSPVSVTCAPSASTAIYGGSIVWTAHASGGSGAYSYSWADTAGHTAATGGVNTFGPFVYSPGSIGASVIALDSNNSQASGNCSTTVISPTPPPPPPPPPSVSASCGASTNANGSITWSVLATGGTGSYTYSWADTAGHQGSTGSATTYGPFTYNASSVSASVIAVDSSGVQATANCSTSVARPSITIICTPKTNTDGSITWFASATGGTGMYSYAWSDTAGHSGLTGGISSFGPYFYPSSTLEGATVIALDNNNMQGTANCSVVAMAPIQHNLALGASGPEVSTLQNILSMLGYFTGSVTGYFGSATQAAVTAFQSENNLAAVGVVGPLTRDLLLQQHQ